MDNRELFDIIIQSLVTLSEAHRNIHLGDNDFIFSLRELSRIVSYKKSNPNPNLFNSKLKKGIPLLKTQARRLIKYLRKNIHNNPQGLHDTIYDIRKHIVSTSKIWYWDKYDMHFSDLYTPQMKSLLDVTLGLNVFGNDFIPDARVYITRNGYVVEGLFSMYQDRHHIRDDAGYLIFDGKEFKLIPLDRESHERIHSLDIITYQETADLLNARLSSLHELMRRSQKEGVTIEDFRNSKSEGIWDELSDKTLNDWIERWNDYKSMSEEKFYETHYPEFYEKIYIPFMRDFELYKTKNPNCQLPEFWFWYSSNYLGEESL